MRNKFQANPTRKTFDANRKTYQFSFVDGTEVVIRPEDFPDAEVWIAWEHKADDREVYHNLKNLKTSGEWNISLDKQREYELEAPIQIADPNFRFPDETENLQVEKLREIVSTLSEVEQQIYELKLQDYSNVEIAEKLFGNKKKESSVRYHFEKIVEKIKKNF